MIRNTWLGVLLVPAVAVCVVVARVFTGAGA